jgi:hypothetical protein
MATIVEYRRAAGRRHTYRITVGPQGHYVIALGDRVLKRGRDSLVERGYRAPGAEAEESSLKYATLSVEYLVGMKEE